MLEFVCLSLRGNLPPYWNSWLIGLVFYFLVEFYNDSPLTGIMGFIGLVFYFFVEFYN